MQSPSPPQLVLQEEADAHVSEFWHAVVTVLHTLEALQAGDISEPPEQVGLPLQTPLGQHGWPVAPHAAQVPFMHTCPVPQPGPQVTVRVTPQLSVLET